MSPHDDLCPTCPNLYSVLGCHILSTKQEIRQAYLRLCLKLHPDRTRDSDPDSRAAFLEVQEAYEVLSDDESRSAYDLLLLSYLSFEEYLRRYEDLTLTAQGLGMSGRAPAAAY